MQVRGNHVHARREADPSAEQLVLTTAARTSIFFPPDRSQLAIVLLVTIGMLKVGEGRFEITVGDKTLAGGPAPVLSDPIY